MTTLPPEENDGQAAEQHAAGEAAAQPTPSQPEAPAPQQPAAPVPPPAAPQYQAPPAGAYQQPPQQPPQGYQQPQATTDPASTITLNYWLSVFFTWLPALIFWMIEKDKGNQRANEFHVANLNFSLIRTGVGVVGWILGLIPYIGWIIAILVWIASIVLFVFHIMAAAKAPDAYRQVGRPEFVFNYPLVK